jgi:hypothetical protein
MKQLTVSVKNQPGSLAEICDLLGKNGVNIVSLFGTGMEYGGEGAITLMTADEKTATRVLEKAGYRVSSTDIVTVKLLDRPGELAKATLKLAHAGVNIDNIYLLNKEKGEAVLAIRTNDAAAAQNCLK